MNLIDIAVIVFIFAVTLISAKKGFIKAIFNLSAYALAGVVSKIFVNPVTSYVYDSFLRVKVIDVLENMLPSGSVSGEINTVVESALSSLPSFVTSLASHFGITASSVTSEISNETLSIEFIESEYLAPVVSAVVSVIVLILLFILFAIVFRIIFSFVDKALNSDKHKVIRSSNRILGAILGFIKSLIPAGVICAVLNIASPVISNESFSVMVTESFFCKLIADMLS